ncbi:MAG: copper amine oxidase N-terminal domain-containing protein, partial [Bacillota bacterium]
DGEMLSTGTPIIINSKTLLPLRDLLISLGVENDEQHIIWNGSEHSVTAIKDSVNLYLKVGNINAKVNDQSFSLDAAPVNYKGKVYIPARFAAEAFSKSVFWDSEFNRIYIRDTAQFNEIKNILDQSYSLFNRTNYYKGTIVLENTVDEIDGSFQKNYESTELYKALENSYSKALSPVSDGSQYIEETYQCNNQFIYSKNSYISLWEKKMLSASHNLNEPSAFLPFEDKFYASLLMETDQRNHLIHLKQDPYLTAALDEINFDSTVNRTYASYDITIDSESGYIVKLIIRERVNGNDVMLFDQSVTFLFYDFNKRFNIDFPQEVLLDLQKTIMPKALVISNEERNIIENLNKSVTFESIDIYKDKLRPIGQNTGILICALADQKSLNAYNSLSENAKTIFCNENAKDHQLDFSQCDGVNVLVEYDDKVYSDLVTGYDFLLQKIKLFEVIL